ncbi:MAG: globin domain-containing protein [Gammaproteobacteria bacterium]|nr:globin domain-containing protein [Gammaproteobacteria bacterium]
MSNYEILFEASYDRVVGKGVGINPKGEAFFSLFYENFFRKSPEIRDKFKNTDMKKQVGVLQKSTFHLISFYVSKEENEYLHEIAVSHNRHGYNIKPEFYDLWLDALIETVSMLDPECDRRVQLAWRMAFTPGILYMQSVYNAVD